MALVLAVASVTGCGTAAAIDAPPATTPERVGFDLAAVRASFLDECLDPILVDDLFCAQVEIAGLRADADTLIAPTTLNAAATVRAAAICRQLAVAHFDGVDRDLGYVDVGTLDREGRHLAACSVERRPPRYRGGWMRSDGESGSVQDPPPLRTPAA